MAVYNYPRFQVTVSGSGLATESEQQAQTALLTAIESNTDGLEASLSTLAGAVSGTEMQVDIVSAPTLTVQATNLDIRDLSSVSDSVSAVQSGAWNITNISGTVSLPTGASTEAKQDTQITHLSSLAGTVSGSELQVDIVSAPTLTVQSTNLDIRDLSYVSDSVNVNLSPVDFLDTAPILDTSSTNIPASAGNPVQIVSSLAAAVKKIQIVDDIGEYYGIYTGAALSEVLVAVVPLGGGDVEVSIPAATRISLRALKNTAISSGFVAMNFLG